MSRHRAAKPDISSIGNIGSPVKFFFGATKQSLDLLDIYIE